MRILNKMRSEWPWLENMGIIIGVIGVIMSPLSYKMGALNEYKKNLRESLPDITVNVENFETDELQLSYAIKSINDNSIVYGGNMTTWRNNEDILPYGQFSIINQNSEFIYGKPFYDENGNAPELRGNQHYEDKNLFLSRHIFSTLEISTNTEQIIQLYRISISEDSKSLELYREKKEVYEQQFPKTGASKNVVNLQISNELINSNYNQENHSFLNIDFIVPAEHSGVTIYRKSYPIIENSKKQLILNELARSYVIKDEERKYKIIEL